MFGVAAGIDPVNLHPVAVATVKIVLGNATWYRVGLCLIGAVYARMVRSFKWPRVADHWI